MHAAIEQLLQEAPVITDGAWGTQMQARGLPVGEAPEAWNLTNPDAVRDVAKTYVDAGSRIILTNTFGGSRLLLERHGLAESATDINRAAAEISVSAADTAALVFGSIGPSGKMVMMGEVTEDELFAAFSEQASALQEGGAHGIAVETMGALDELQCAVRAAKQTGLPVVACMVYDSGADLDRTLMGVTPEQAVEAMEQAGADVVGANCGQGIDGYIPICRRMAAVTSVPIWIKPNAGLPEMVDGQAVYKTTPAEFAAATDGLIEAGAAFVGGCCGTSPEFIRAIRSRLDSKQGGDGLSV